MITEEYFCPLTGDQPWPALSIPREYFFTSNLRKPATKPTTTDKPPVSLEDSFRAQLDAEPCDWATRLVYADFLEDQDRNDEALFQRWLVENKKAPTINTLVDKVPCWDWWEDFTPNAIKHGKTPLIEPKIYRCLKGCSDDAFARYTSRQKAEDDLFLVLVKTGSLKINGDNSNG